jgi:hypothetical protein
VRYSEENLKNKLRTNKGLLPREDFNHVQKVMEVYAKALLYQIRIDHQEQRYQYLEKGKEDIGRYVDIYND